MIKMPHRFLHKQNKKEIVIENIITEKCRSCEIGQMQLRNYLAYHKDKSISLTNFKYNGKAFAMFCTSCLHNGMRGMKRRIAKTVGKSSIPGFESLQNFQELDMYKEAKGKKL